MRRQDCKTWLSSSNWENHDVDERISPCKAICRHPQHHKSDMCLESDTGMEIFGSLSVAPGAKSGNWVQGTLADGRIFTRR